MTDAFSDALYFACGKTSGSKATRDYQPRSFLASLAGSERNAEEATIDWQFTTADARIKLKKLYPVLNATGQNQ
ncbi:hypothetical protein [Legionella antarctica]|nr:hypothetical protein [Legionella antarctica]